MGRTGRSEPSRRFKDERPLGEGTFAEVHLALDCETGRSVAVKRAKTGVRGAAEQLKKEADVLRHLSPQCALVPRFLGSTDGGSLVSDALLGGSVSDLRRAAGGEPFALPEAVRLARGMLKALRAVHEAGVVHRDVKPSNFVLDDTEHQTVYLVDLGCARVVKGVAARPGKVGFHGSSMYASVRAHAELEQGPVDDLWSLAFVVIDMVTGSLPWKELVLKRRRERLSPRKEAARIKQQSLANVGTFPGLDAHPGLREVLTHLDGLGEGEPADYDALDGMLCALERQPPPARSTVPVRKRNRLKAFYTPGTDYFNERLRTGVQHCPVRVDTKRACVLCGGYERGADGLKKRRGHVSAVTCSFCPGGVHLCDRKYRNCFKLFHEKQRLGGQE